MDIQSSLPSPSQEEHLARLEAEEQANERLYKVLDIGQAMLQSGAEVSRVEDSLRRICLAYGAERADVFTITSNIMVTMYSRQYGALTQIGGWPGSNTICTGWSCSTCCAGASARSA